MSKLPRQGWWAMFKLHRQGGELCQNCLGNASVMLGARGWLCQLSSVRVLNATYKRWAMCKLLRQGFGEQCQGNFNIVHLINVMLCIHIELLPHVFAIVVFYILYRQCNVLCKTYIERWATTIALRGLILTTKTFYNMCTRPLESTRCRGDMHVHIYIQISCLYVCLSVCRPLALAPRGAARRGAVVLEYCSIVVILV